MFYTKLFTYLVLGRFCRALSRIRDGALLLLSASVFIFCRGKKITVKITWLVKQVNAYFQSNSASFVLPILTYQGVCNLILEINNNS